MSLTVSSVYSFGSFRLDPANRLLLRGGARVSLTPKAFELLLLLVEGRGDLLTKDQLMQTIWPDTFVDEANLTQHVATLRKILGESDSDSPYIETVPKRGYRFVVPVEVVVTERADSGSRRPSLAVLPFNLFGVDAADSFMSLGIADTLITKLGHSTRISVRSTSVVAKYEAKAHDVNQVGRLLNVDFVLSGAVYKQGQLFRINLQLVRVTDRNIVWTEQVDLNCTNIFAVENMLVRKVDRALLPAVTGTKRRRRRQTPIGAAYRQYLKGRYFWNKRSEEDLHKGIACFKEAIAIDENYALAYAGLADSFLMLINYGVMSSKEGFPLAKAATLKALELDPDLGEAHASLGYINAAFEWDWSGCEVEFRRSIELNPTDITPRHWYAVLLTIMGRFEEALDELEKAREIDPVSLILGAMTGWILCQMGRYEEARLELLKTLDLDSNYHLAQLYLARVYVIQGRTDDAVAAFKRALATLSENASIRAELAHALAKAGRKTESRLMLRELLDRSKQDCVPPYYLAMVYAGLQEDDRAFTYLQQACEERDLRLFWFRREPRFESLKEDTRYVELLRRMGLAA